MPQLGYLFSPVVNISPMLDFHECFGCFFFLFFFFACVCVFAGMFLIREIRHCIVWSFCFGLRLKSQQIQRSIMRKNGVQPISIFRSLWSEEGRTTHSLPRSLKPMLLCHTPLFSLLTLQGTLKHLWLSWGYGGSLVRLGKKITDIWIQTRLKLLSPGWRPCV